MAKSETWWVMKEPLRIKWNPLLYPFTCATTKSQCWEFFYESLHRTGETRDSFKEERMKLGYRAVKVEVRERENE